VKAVIFIIYKNLFELIVQIFNGGGEDDISLRSRCRVDQIKPSK